jgi:hypothetical protein
MFLFLHDISNLGHQETKSTEPLVLFSGGDVVPSDCTLKGCRYRPNSIGAPWCYIPREQGYVMRGQPVAVDNGWIVYLRKNSTLTLYGDVIYDVVIDVEFQTEERLRVKVKHAAEERFTPQRMYCIRLILLVCVGRLWYFYIMHVKKITTFPVKV